MHKLETFTKAHIRKKVVKDRSRDRKREKSGFFSWCFSATHVHYYRKVLRRFLFGAGTVLFGTGLILLVLTYTPTASYNDGKITGPVLIVIGIVLVVTAGLWMVYKKDVKKSRNEAYKERQRELQLKNPDRHWPRLGNQDYNKTLHDLVSAALNDGKRNGTFNNDTFDSEPASSRRQRRRNNQLNSKATIETSDIKVDVPEIQIERPEEDWQIALAIANAIEKERIGEEENVASTSKSLSGCNGANNPSYQQYGDESSDTEHVVQLETLSSETMTSLSVPGKNKHTTEVVIEHHNLDKRDNKDDEGGLKGNLNIKRQQQFQGSKLTPIETRKLSCKNDKVNVSGKVVPTVVIVGDKTVQNASSVPVKSRQLPHNNSMYDQSDGSDEDLNNELEEIETINLKQTSNDNSNYGNRFLRTGAPLPSPRLSPALRSPSPSVMQTYSNNLSRDNSFNNEVTSGGKVGKGKVKFRENNLDKRSAKSTNKGKRGQNGNASTNRLNSNSNISNGVVLKVDNEVW